MNVIFSITLSVDVVVRHVGRFFGRRLALLLPKVFSTNVHGIGPAKFPQSTEQRRSGAVRV